MVSDDFRPTRSLFFHHISLIIIQVSSHWEEIYPWKLPWHRKINRKSIFIHGGFSSFPAMLINELRGKKNYMLSSPTHFVADSKFSACKFRSFSLKEKTPWLPYLGSLTSTSEARDGNPGQGEKMLKKNTKREHTKTPAFFWKGWLVGFDLVGFGWLDWSRFFSGWWHIGLKWVLLFEIRQLSGV